MKNRARSFWRSGPKAKAVLVGVPVLLLFLLTARCGGGAGKAEIEFVKGQAFEGNDTVPVGVAIERNAEDVEWKLDESEAGIKFVEATGTLKEKGKRICVQHFGLANNIACFKAIPEVYRLLWEQLDEYRCFWVSEPVPLPDMSRLSRFITAWQEFKNGKEVVASYDGRRILASDAGFQAAVRAMEKASDEEDASDVEFRMQFPMPVANYDGKGRFDPEKATFRQGYSGIRFTKGPLAGVEIECDLLPILK